jgi:purine-binding chemotaxis protein CheW
MAQENYGIRITQVREIIGMRNITQVPGLPDFIQGVINLRGTVIPVVDLRVRFDLGFRQYDERTPIIITEVSCDDGTMKVGIVVDRVSEVLTVDENNFQSTPSFGIDIGTQYIQGMAQRENTLYTLLDIYYVITSKELGVMCDLYETKMDSADSTVTE